MIANVKEIKKKKRSGIHKASCRNVKRCKKSKNKILIVDICSRR